MSSNIEVEQQNREIIGDIQNLQNVEMDLFKTLENGIANKSMDLKQQQDIVSQITNVANMRENLYKTLNKVHNHYKGVIPTPGSIIGHQLNAMNVVETELQEAKKRLNLVEEEKNNKQRLTEINTFYGSRYENHANIMKSIVLFCIPLIVLTLLANYGFIPNSIYVFIFGIICVIAIIRIFRLYLESISHDNMNYQEYVWGKTPPDHPIIGNGSKTDDPWKGIGDIACVAQACCEDGFTWVPGEPPLNKCLPNNALPEGVKPYQATLDQKTESAPANVSGASILTNAFNSARNASISDTFNKAKNAIVSSPASMYDSLTGSS